METKAPDVMASEVLLAVNDRDFSKIEPLTTEDVQLRFPPGQLFKGRTGIEQFLREVERRLPEMTMIGHHVRSGPGFAVVEYEMKGTSKDRQTHEAMGCLVLEFDGDRVKQGTLYVDTAAWQRLA